MGDPTSYANFEEISTKELSLNLSVDFNRKILAGVVTYTIEAHAADVSTLVSTLGGRNNRDIWFFQVLDTRGLNIQDVVAVDSGEHLRYTLGDAHHAFGSPLTIHFPTTLSIERLLYPNLI